MSENQKNITQEMTLEVDNTELEKCISQYNERKTQENLEQLIVALKDARLLVPATPEPQNGQPIPCLIKNAQGELYFPVYSSKEEIPKEPKMPIVINMAYRAVNQFVAKGAVDAKGIVINPFSSGIVFKKPLVMQIEEMIQSDFSGKEKTLQLTEKEYVKMERRQFEYGFLPQTFFNKGADFMNQLTEEREAYLDRLFEESYQNKRMYPYLEEDFSVMIMNISDELRVIRADLPKKDMAMPSCYRIYFAWNMAKDTGRYFVIEKGAENGIYLGEIAKDWSHLKYGPAPAEGAELNKVIELIQGV